MRRRRYSGWRTYLLPGAAGIALAPGLFAEPMPAPTAADIQLLQRLAPASPSQPAQPAQPAQPSQPAQPAASPGTTGTGGSEAGARDSSLRLAGLSRELANFGSPGGTESKPAESPVQKPVEPQPGNILVSAVEVPVRLSTDLGDLLAKSPSAPGVVVQKRTPIVSDPRPRGYRVGQLLTVFDAAPALPARMDLDTLVSKIDSRVLDDVVVIKGPYSVRYGPGFAFLDVESRPTPRYQCSEVHGSTTLDYKTNGEAWHGRQAVWGGGSDYGFRVGYDLKTGSDYRTGAGFDLPSSYRTGNVDFALGYDLSPDSHLEIRGIRLDQYDVEFPGQIFDIGHLVTDNYTVRYVLENQDYFDRLTLDGWYNYTRFNGDAQRPGKRRQIPQLDNPLQLFALTEGDVATSGFRSAMTWGQAGCSQVTAGVDFRWVSQYLNEFDVSRNPFFAQSLTGNFPIPRSHITDPGVYVDAVVPVSDRLKVKAGARFDFASTDIDATPPGRSLVPGAPNSLIDRQFYGTTDLSNQYNLWAAYLTAEYQLNDHWTLTGGLGSSQRPPTLTELYAAQPLVLLLQQGFSFVQGSPGLSPEQLRQIDVGVRGSYEHFRGGANAFHGWVSDYITLAAQGTFQGFPANDLQTPLGVRFVNTDQATLWGFELYGEVDANEYVTPFLVMGYVEGRDQTRGNRGRAPGTFSGPKEPLPGIPPLEARAGLRLHDAGPAPTWGVEWAARMVDGQDRVAASLREQRTAGFTTFDVRAFWQARQSLLLTAGVENFGDRFYREHLDSRTGNGVFQPGVNFYFGAQVTY